MSASSPTPPTGRPLRYVFDSHHRLAVAGAAAAIAFFLLHGRTGGPTQMVGTWDVFAGCCVGLAWAVILTQDPFETRRAVRLQDSSRTFLFVVVLVAAVASLLAVGMMLGQAKNLPERRLAGHVALSIATVALSWALVHTIFTLRYAHHYYKGAGNGPRGNVAGGLIFPEEKSPDYLDFAYFAFVVGMTCQVSDVQISSRTLRRTALWHGLIAFAFNTAILALVVNIVAGLL